jgi:hypothetical protein
MIFLLKGVMSLGPLYLMVSKLVLLSQCWLVIVKSFGYLKEATESGPSIASEENRFTGVPGITSYHEGTLTTIPPSLLKMDLGRNAT